MFKECNDIAMVILQVDCGQYVEGSSGSIAIEGGASATVQIKTCTREYNPVCSLEGRSYSNQCSFCHSLAVQHKISRCFTYTIYRTAVCNSERIVFANQCCCCCSHILWGLVLGP